ncbi:hypothetical protein M9H77_03103 [Catharanthus roseus]|uniref:Uncharacterized protein n=1 Tax=Catharanthus roseus TaxID=4058 RepID=A0ACC0CAB0_CATRO|nr:hypothetical protein M9H77_03103 [Catharanthus roseus]
MMKAFPLKNCCCFSCCFLLLRPIISQPHPISSDAGACQQLLLYSPDSAALVFSGAASSCSLPAAAVSQVSAASVPFSAAAKPLLSFFLSNFLSALTALLLVFLPLLSFPLSFGLRLLRSYCFGPSSLLSCF